MNIPEVKATVSPKIDHIKCCLCIRRGRKKDKDDSSDSDLSNDKATKKVVKKYMQNNIFMIIKQKSTDFIRAIS